MPFYIIYTDKEYHFTISEVDDHQEHIVYDTHTEDVYVTVTDVGTEHLQVAITYDSDGAVFTNRYDGPKQEEKVTEKETEKETESSDIRFYSLFWDINVRFYSFLQKYLF